MGMNKADILVDCINDKLGGLVKDVDYLVIAGLVADLADLADPQATTLRAMEKERDRLLVLATKHCPKEHHDWEEIIEAASAT